MISGSHLAIIWATVLLDLVVAGRQSEAAK